MITTIKQLKDFAGQEVTLNGWVYNIRSIGKIWFLILRDGTGLVQCVVVKAETDETIFKLENVLTKESSVTITGMVRAEPRSVGEYELGVTNIVVHQIAQEYPISNKGHGTDFLMKNRHLWLRSKNQNAILRVRHQVVKATRDFFDDNGFTLMDSPILTGNPVEGTSTLFELEYFDRSAYLTQSGQLYGEASAMAFGKIYVFGPTFRAEKSKTRRHLTEFWMIEPEMAYCDLEENMDWAEKYVSYVVQWCLKHCKEELKICASIS
jgi:asparaginyl-tRNA synthetase